MTNKEVFDLITSERKWYSPKSEQWAYSFKRRFKKGQVKQSTLIKFFAKFGYIQKEIEWERLGANAVIDAVIEQLQNSDTNRRESNG